MTSFSMRRQLAICGVVTFMFTLATPTIGYDDIEDDPRYERGARL
jgi:hypothetical protein